MKNKKLLTAFLIKAAIVVSLTMVPVATNAFRQPSGILIGNFATDEYTILDGVVTFKLPENITTGYSWHYAVSKEGVIELVTDKYIEALHPGVVGAPGVHIWVFKAIAPGTTIIRFDYYRSWEGIGQSVDTRDFSVIVDDAGDINVREIR